MAYFLELEERERGRTGIPTLKVGYNAVFGYYLEVTRPYYHQVPKEYRPLQTLKDRQRYALPEMKERERELYRLEALIKRREEEVFLALRERAKREAEVLREAARSWPSWTSTPPSPRWRCATATPGPASGRGFA